MSGALHGRAGATTVTLPANTDVTSYTLLWDSADDHAEELDFRPGAIREVAGTSMQLFRAN